MAEPDQTRRRARRKQSAGGVVLHQDRVLVLHKREVGELRLPKGTVEEGEPADLCALREVGEETGFTALEIQADLGRETVWFAAGEEWVERQEQYFLMRLLGFQREPRSRRDAMRFQVRWLPVDEALSRLTFGDEREFVRRAAELS